MATTNKEIIATAMVLNNLDPITDVVNTFAGWKTAGYIVRRGEKAAFNTKIWKPCKSKKDENNESTDEGTCKRMYLVNASFFTDKQVEKLEKKESIKDV